MSGDEARPKRHCFADLGPAWISAIVALIAALVAAAGFFAGRVTAPSSAGPQAATVVNGSSSTSGPASAGGQPPGTVLAHYTADVAAGWGIDIAPQPQRPREGIPGDASLVVPMVDRISSSDGGKLAQLDNSVPPTYDSCAANTRFTTTAYVKRGDAFCYTGRGYLAAVKVTNKVIVLTGDYVTLDITVWKSP